MFNVYIFRVLTIQREPLRDQRAGRLIDEPAHTQRTKEGNEWNHNSQLIKHASRDLDVKKCNQVAVGKRDHASERRRRDGLSAKGPRT